VMIALTLLFFYSKLSFDSPFQYVVYIAYAFGIVWTLYDFSKNGEHSGKFGEFFLQGFRCFIVVTLLMVLFTAAFNMLHPEFKEQMAIAYKEELVKKGNTTAPEIESNIKKMKDFYIVMLISGAIFGYLIIGAVVTLATTLMYTRRK
jgi:uncharacterized membrane protein YedE/YeeE